jgi:lipopolysaccharide biosynthesis glycosyltransferase
MGLAIINPGPGIYYIKPAGGNIKSIIIHFRLQGSKYKIYANKGEVITCDKNKIEETLDRVLEIVIWGRELDKEPVEMGDINPTHKDFI